MTSSVLRIEHAVPDYDRWKREAFDRDPIDRAGSGVRRFRVLRSSDDSDLVAIELDFDDRAAAEAFAAGLTELWRGVRGRFGWRELPETRLFELTATGEY